MNHTYLPQKGFIISGHSIYSLLLAVSKLHANRRQHKPDTSIVTSAALYNSLNMIFKRKPTHQIKPTSFPKPIRHPRSARRTKPAGQTPGVYPVRIFFPTGNIYTIYTSRLYFFLPIIFILLHSSYSIVRRDMIVGA